MRHEHFSRICISIVLVISSVIFLFSHSFADEEKGEKSQRDHSLYAGSWSLQFQIEDDIGLKPFNGMIISLKRHLSGHSAFRIGLDVDIDSDGGDYNLTSVALDETEARAERRTDRNSQRVELGFAYLNYPNPGSTINMFWGVGPLISYSRSRQKTDVFPGYNWSEPRHASDSYSSRWSLGTLGLAGVEWFATEDIGFHAEYRASLAYYRSKTERVDTYFYDSETRRYDTDASRDGWDLDGVSVILGISLYF